MGKSTISMVIFNGYVSSPLPDRETFTPRHLELHDPIVLLQGGLFFVEMGPAETLEMRFSTVIYSKKHIVI